MASNAVNEARLPLSVHHIGARAGTRTFPHLFCERDVVNVLYEADPSAIAQIRERNAAHPSRLVVYPHCIDAKKGRRDFYLYSNRYYSSFYPFDPAYAASYHFDAQFGWDDDPSGKTAVETISLETISLDELLAAPGAAPPPDFLSLDTQGSELDILRGAARILETSCVALHTEVSFAPMYAAQPLFHEIQAYLATFGFELATLDVFPSPTRAPKRVPIGLRGRGHQTQGEALFLKKPHTITARHAEPQLDLVKSMFMHFVFMFFGDAFLIADSPEFESAWAAVAPSADKMAYLRFCRDFVRIAQSYPRLYAPTYSQVVPPTESAARFDGSLRITHESIRDRYLAGSSLDDLTSAAGRVIADKYIGVEELAAVLGMRAHAEALKEQRLRALSKLFSHLGFAADNAT